MQKLRLRLCVAELLLLVASCPLQSTSPSPCSFVCFFPSFAVYGDSVHSHPTVGTGAGAGRETAEIQDVGVGRTGGSGNVETAGAGAHTGKSGIERRSTAEDEKGARNCTARDRSGLGEGTA